MGDSDVAAFASCLIERSVAGSRTLWEAANHTAVDLIQHYVVLQSNLTDFATHDAAIELCGLLSRNRIDRPKFDELYKAGMEKASGSGEWGVMDKTLGKQAGAALARSLDDLFHERGQLAILEKAPLVAG